MKNASIQAPQSCSVIVPETEAETRIDAFLAKQFPTYSRTYCHQLVSDDYVLLNGKKVHKPSTLVKPHDTISINFPAPAPLGVPKPIPGDLGARIIYEHPQFLIVYKPAGLVVHAPHTDSTEITLVDWLLTIFKDLAEVGSPERPGIVHRLDKETSGLMIIPRNNYAHTQFGAHFKDRKIHKTYWSIIKGHPQDSGTISYPIDRHPYQKHKMTHLDNHTTMKWNLLGREATTHYKVLEKFDGFALVEAKPVTGRTHQIRVHFAAIGHPLIGDLTYGVKSSLIERQALHAHSLSFEFEGEQFTFSHDVPEDFAKALTTLRTSS